MIETMIAGETDPEALSDLAKRKLRSKKTDLKRALNGLMGPHQKLMLGSQLRHVDYLDEEIGRLDEEIKKRMLPFEEDLELLDTIPGVARRTAETILAEIGSNMDQYPSVAHLCSWAPVFCLWFTLSLNGNNPTPSSVQLTTRNENGTRSSSIP